MYDEQSECKRARYVASMQAPIRGIFQEISERTHRPMGFDAMALTGKALEEASWHVMREFYSSEEGSRIIAVLT
jgi:hypothetical protein